MYEPAKLPYELMVQGFLQKGATIAKLQEQLQLTVTYWQTCLHPNRFE